MVYVFNGYKLCFFCLVKELNGTGKKVLGGGGGGGGGGKGGGGVWPKQGGVVHDVLSLVQGVGCTILSYP